MALPGAEVFERAGLRAWPGIEVEHDGHWVRRAANGYTKRANSVQPLDPADVADAPARIAAARTWFERRGLRSAFRITPLAGGAVVDALDAAGWVAIDHSQLWAMDLGSTAPDPRGELLAPDDRRFLDAQQRLQDYSDVQRHGLAALLAALDVPAAGIVLAGADGAPAASGLVAIADGIAVAGNVVTDRAQRRQGLAAAMMRSGLDWAYRQGARIAALNVMAGNDAALALYRGLGFRPQYDYCYRVPGDEC